MRFWGFIFSLLIFSSCQNSDDTPSLPNNQAIDSFIKAADISYYPTIREKGLTFFNTDGQPQNFLAILKNNGINTLRLRLWHTPDDSHASFTEVASFSSELKSIGFKVWLTVHYSDEWADPSKQIIPSAWQNASVSVLQDSVYQYTKKIIETIRPDIIQIGNEIDNGFLHPLGNLHTEQEQFLELLNQGIKAVRTHSTTTKIMLHKADPNTASWFFNIVRNLDYDLMGLSYYPLWHGKDLNLLKNQMEALTKDYPQELVLAETSYPFTLGWNDFTNNIIGSNNQIIYPEYPATLTGQKEYLEALINTIKPVNRVVGLGYWGAEWVAFEGSTATNGSTYENQALFDFTLKATPALTVFKD